MRWRNGEFAYVVVAGELSVVVCLLVGVGFVWTIALMLAAEIAATAVWRRWRQGLDDDAAQLHSRDG
jgi:membrane protein implicated in regulation of membrane protease activity